MLKSNNRNRSNALLTYTRASILWLAVFTFMLGIYFGHGLFRSALFSEELQKLPRFFELIEDLGKERAMQILSAFEEGIDPQNLEILRSKVDAEIKHLGLDKNPDFKESLKVQRGEISTTAGSVLAMLDENITNKRSGIENLDANASAISLLELITPVDDTLLDYLIKMRLKNVNAELNGLLYAIWRGGENIILQNQIRDFLFKFTENRVKLDDDENQQLDDLYFTYAEHGEIIAQNELMPSYMTFNALDEDYIRRVEQRRSYIQPDIEEFYDVIHFAIRESNVEASYVDLISICNEISAKSIRLIKNMIVKAYDLQKSSINILWVYTMMCFGMSIFCVAMLVFLSARKKELIDDLELAHSHVENLKSIARRRGVNPDSADMHELFGRVSEFINEADLVELKNKNEYNFFLSNISHEINNPLNDIKGFGQNFQKVLREDEKQACIKGILAGAMKLEKIFDNLLKIASIQTNNLHLKEGEIYFFDMINEIQRKMSLRAKEADIKFVSFIDPSIEGLIVCDYEKMYFILENIITNAIKYNKKHGKVMLFIRKLENLEGKIKIEFNVIDRGKGFDNIEENILNQENIKSRIFSAKGINIAIIHEYLKLMKSGLHISSEKDKGSRFYFDITFDFKEEIRLKNRFVGDDKVYVYSEGIHHEHELPEFDGVTLPNYKDMVASYLSYMGLSYEITSEKKDGIYIFHGDTLPFEVKKCIFCADDKPGDLKEGRVFLQEPTCPNIFANVYEVLTERSKGANTLMQAQVYAVALLDYGDIDLNDIQENDKEEDLEKRFAKKSEVEKRIAEYETNKILHDEMAKDIQKAIGEEIAYVHTSVDPNTKYSIAIVYTDNPKNIEKIPKGVHVIALTSGNFSASNSLNTNCTYFASVIKSANNKDGICSALRTTLRKFKNLILDSGIEERDVLLYKKSRAANNIYKMAISSFATYVDAVNSAKEFKEHLMKYKYKIVLCDYGLSDIRIDTYKAMMQEANKIHHGFTRAGLFVSSEENVSVSRNDFEIFSANITKMELGQKLSGFLGDN